MSVETEDASTGYEIRLSNQLTLEEVDKLPKNISHEYIARIIATQNRVDDSKETLILSEELQN